MNVYITSEPMLKLWSYIEALDTEVGGWGYAKLDRDNLIWNDVFLVPQYASKSEVDFESVGGDEAALERAIADGVLGTDGFVWVSWHSHHTMKPFWSNTDDKRIVGLGSTGINHVLSFVGCHDHTYRLRLDLFGVEHHGITVPQVTMDDLRLTADPQDALIGGVLEEIETNVLKRPVVKHGTQLAPVKKIGENDPGAQLERALTIRALMEAGLDRSEAEKYADEAGDEWFVGPAGLVSGDGFDQMAWGD
jgi:hypothetical protein